MTDENDEDKKQSELMYNGLPVQEKDIQLIMDVCDMDRKTAKAEIVRCWGDLAEVIDGWSARRGETQESEET